ncbi:FkbM family methyltransferase [uncultured Methanobrevibacter sp.]|uniref:FkbM family methyltransferase n=1 Tax=uncultured Methanobrevibacter sp. TaxID=253161 RepID=UPI002612FDFF|nr:FkbM family methyltransferase [uncultured Methanobrevibacter sp.]
MSFKEKVLSKSNSYNYYKEKNEELLEELELYKNDKNINETFMKFYGSATNFCNGSYIEYFLRDDFEDNLKEVTKNLNPHTKKAFKRYFLRAMVVGMLKKDSLFYESEIKEQDEADKFRQDNYTGKSIGKYKYHGNLNLAAFIDLNLNDDELEFIKDKDIIDAGAYTGDTSIPLAEFTNKNIYAFEPFEETFNLLCKNVNDNNIKNIIPVQKSLGNLNGKRTLYLSGNNAQGITSDEELREYDDKSNTFVSENNLDVGFITIDVEGAELDLLNGAINTIKTQKPILKISMYHRVTDYFEIIPWVANLGLGYEFKIFKEEPRSFLADIVVQCKVKK